MDKGNQNLNPMDKDFIVIISDLQRQIKELQTTRQPYFSDWIPIDEKLSIGINSIAFADPLVQMTKYFQAGTKVKYLKNGVQCYGYIGFVSANNKVRVFTDTISSFTSSDTISSLQFSNLLNPKGHPFFFRYNAPGTSIPSNVLTTGAIDYRWYMLGTTIVIILTDDTTFGTASSTNNAFFQTNFDVANVVTETSYTIASTSASSSSRLSDILIFSGVALNAKTVILVSYDALGGGGMYTTSGNSTGSGRIEFVYDGSANIL